MKKLTRREFLQLSTLTTAGIVAAACTPGVGAPAPQEAPAPKSADTEAEAASSTVTESQYSDAPSLAELVANGELPTVDERLPIEPLVVSVVEEIGTYGGTWQRAFLGPADGQNIERIQHDRFLEFDTDGFTVVPHVAKDWEITDDGKSITFTLREGMKLV